MLNKLHFKISLRGVFHIFRVDMCSLHYVYTPNSYNIGQFNMF